MSIFIKRKKLYEDGEAAPAAPVAQAAPVAPAAPVAQTSTPAATTSTSDTTTSAAPSQTSSNQSNTESTNQNNNTNQQQTQNQQQNTKPADPNAQKLSKEVSDCMTKINGAISKNDPYVLMAFDIPSTIQSMVPEFTKNNSNASQTITDYESFKQNPSKDTFDKMISSLETFGNGGKKPDEIAQEAVNNQQTHESFNMDFRERLNERLRNSIYMKKHETDIQNSFMQDLTKL